MLSLAYFGITTFLVSTLETCLSDRLMGVFNFRPNDVALYFFAFFGGALTCSIICGLLLRNADKGLVILASLFICSFSLLLIGPSKILHVPITRGVVAIGLYLGGS